jgi:ketosteroid isomerase-like protein
MAVSTTETEQTGAVVTRFYDAWNARDLDGVCACLTCDVVWEVPDAVPFETRLRGREAVAEFLEQVWGFWRELDLAIDKLNAGRDQAAAVGRYRVRTTAGERLEVPFLHAHRLREGSIADFRAHMDSALVVEAVASELRGALGDGSR